MITNPAPSCRGHFTAACLCIGEQPMEAVWPLSFTKTNGSSVLTSRFNTHTNCNFKMQFLKNDRACCVFNSPRLQAGPKNRSKIVLRRPRSGLFSTVALLGVMSRNVNWVWILRTDFEKPKVLVQLTYQSTSGWRDEVLKKLGSNHRILSHSYRIGVPMTFPLTFAGVSIKIEVARRFE